MITFTHDGNTYTLAFEYDKVPVTFTHNGVEVTKLRTRTTAKLTVPDTRVIITPGQVIMSPSRVISMPVTHNPKDRFDLDKARKNALEHLGFYWPLSDNRELRRALWTAYFTSPEAKVMALPPKVSMWDVA